MAVQVTVTCEERTPENVQELVEELAGDLNRLEGADAATREVAAPRGSRGDAISLGTIALTFITSGAAVTALNVLRTYFEREPALKITFKGKDGETIAIDAKHLNGKNAERVVALVERSMAKQG